MSKDIVLTEEEQIEQTKKWLKNNLPSIAIGIGAGLLLVFGFNYYKDQKLVNAQEASSLYQEVINADDNLSRASQELNVFQSDYSGTPYASKVALLSAKHALESGNNEGALESLTWAIENTEEDLVRHTATLRKASILVSTNQLDIELLGDISSKRGEFDQAIKHYQSSLDSSQDPRYNTYLHLKLNKATSLANAKAQ